LGYLGERHPRAYILCIIAFGDFLTLVGGSMTRRAPYLLRRSSTVKVEWSRVPSPDPGGWPELFSGALVGGPVARIRLAEKTTGDR